MRSLLPVLLLSMVLPVVATANAQTADQKAAAAVVQSFHDALAKGDSVTVIKLLAPDALILEAGGLETRADYRGHHLPGDIAFARAITPKQESSHVTVEGNVAWVVATTRTTGTFGERAIDSAGAELVVLTRSADGWLIRAIHWSSRPIRKP